MDIWYVFNSNADNLVEIEISNKQLILYFAFFDF